MRRLASLLVLTAAALLSLATSKVADDDSDAEAVLDSSDAVSMEAALVSITVDDAEGQATAEAVATFAAGRAGTLLQPAGCVTATAQGATVTYTLADCTGPFGLVHVTGTLTAAYTVTAGGLEAHVTGTGLTVNGATVAVDATGVYTTSGAARELAVTSTANGVGPRGVAFTRQGDYALVWDEGMACMTLEGAWSTTVLGRTWSATAAGYTVCAGGCPEPGGELTFTGGLSGVTLTITFDGSGIAQWSTSNGKSGTLPLLCD